MPTSVEVISLTQLNLITYYRSRHTDYAVMASAMIGIQYCHADLVKLPWRSYIIPKTSDNKFMSDVTHRLYQYGDPWLVFQHVMTGTHNDEKHFASNRDHYHVLVSNGNPKTGSDAFYSFVKRSSERHGEHFCCEQVRSYENLIRYLRQKPRKLVDYHYAYSQLVSAGAFQQVAAGSVVEKKRSQTTQERFADLVCYVRNSRARDYREFMQWVLEETDQKTKDTVVKETYPRHDFEKLVGKALSMIVLEHGDYSWRESITQVRKPLTCNMSVARSVECIERFFEENGYDVYEEIDVLEAILDKKTTKQNAIIFKGPTNTGKTLICNSIKHGFRSYADISQGIVNNFWLQPARNKRIIFHDECQWNEENQERIKKLTEGKPCSISLKGLPDEILPRTPYIAACNTWPWVRITQRAHVDAFKTRCKVYEIKYGSWLAEYSEEGDIDPSAWLQIMLKRDDDKLLAEACDVPIANTQCAEAIVEEDDKEDSTEPSYDGYYSDTTTTNELLSEINERYAHWSPGKRKLYAEYHNEFSSTHPSYHGQDLDDCDWREELKQDTPDFPPWNTWKKIKRGAKEVVHAVKVCTGVVHDTMSSIEKELECHEQIDGNDNRPAVVSISSNTSACDEDQDVDTTRNDAVEEEDNESHENIIMGYNVQEFKDCDATRELILKIEHEYLYTYNRSPSDDDMYYELRMLSDTVGQDSQSQQEN